MFKKAKVVSAGFLLIGGLEENCPVDGVVGVFVGDFERDGCVVVV